MICAVNAAAEPVQVHLPALAVVGTQLVVGQALVT